MSRCRLGIIQPLPLDASTSRSWQAEEVMAVGALSDQRLVRPAPGRWMLGWGMLLALTALLTPGAVHGTAHAAPAGARLVQAPEAPAVAQGAPSPQETVAARQRFFGVENVDPVTGQVRSDRVILSWFSISSLAAAFAGRVVLLDSYIYLREDEPGIVPTTLEELIALDPEAIFIGHGHFDHDEGAGIIAASTGSLLVGTPEHCDQARLEARRVLGGEPTVTCVEAVTRDSEPGAEVRDLDVLAPEVCLTSFKHLHSAATAHDADHPFNPVVPVPDPGSALTHGPAGSPALEALPSTMGEEGAEGWSMAYQFRLGEFSLLWHDTTGPISDNAPQVIDVLRALPSTDVEMGSAVVINAPNGLRDQAVYIEAVEPKIFVPLHHDLTPHSADDYEAAMEREMTTLAEDERPILRWLYDPVDYLRPGLLTYDPAAPYWATDDPAGRPPAACSSVASAAPGADAAAPQATAPQATAPQALKPQARALPATGPLLPLALPALLLTALGVALVRRRHQDA